MFSAGLPVLLFIALSTGLAVAMLGVASLLGPRRQGAVKEMPYESGMDPIHDARRRFDVRFHLIAVAFLLFDVEVIFLYPWAVAHKHAEGLGAVRAGDGLPFSVLVLLEVMVFIALLALGLVYVWRRGLFRWR